MNKKLYILTCRNFAQEVNAVLVEEEWTDVVSRAFPVRCGRPPITWEELRSLLADDCEQIVVLGSACLKGLGEPPADLPPALVNKVEQCFHLIAGPNMVNDAIGSGVYLMTPAWLAEWHKNLEEMGFTPEHADEFFRNFAKELVLFNTGVNPDIELCFSELQENVKLPCRRFAVGLDYTKLLLTRLVLEWRLERERRDFQERKQYNAGILADHVSAMDMLAQLTSIQNEDKAIAAIEDLFRMLFAPADLFYIRVKNEVFIPKQPIPEEMLATMQGLRDVYDWTLDGQGFIVRIGKDDEILGVLAVDRLAFPEHRERYLNLAIALIGVCGLVIENARNRKKLLEAEKMASLGILVAGVAHEINTPVGVVLAAVTALQGQSRQLKRSFSERSMTESGLQKFLESATSATGLIRENIERIGHLTETFHQVAVEGGSIEKQLFLFRECLEEVIISMGERLPAKRIAVNIKCDPDLQIKSIAGDWVTIFMNLIDNSLKHGFKDREHGTIDIVITRTSKILRVNYHDDGAGMKPDVLARIFDPFFTTNLQQGMGLGMHLVYNLITHRLGGTIQGQSPKGRGVLFHIEVPQ